MVEKNKVMLMTDSSIRTGFGGVSHNIAVGLAEAGFETTFLGWGFQLDSPVPRTNYLLLPSGREPFGNDVLPFYIQNFKPEVLITQADTRMIAWLPQQLKQIANKPQWVFYVVVDGNVWDHKGANTKWPSNWTSVIKQADKVVAMTKYGQRILTANGVESTVIYHGVDTTRFKPISEENKKALKKQVGLGEDVFVFGGVFKNMQRKCPEKYLQAFKIFYEDLSDVEKEKVALLIHTPNVQPGPTGGEFDLIQQTIDYGLTPGKNVVFSVQGLPAEMIQLVYQTMDVFLHLGTMEGFGLPIIEAMSCGLPSVGVNSCTMPELFGDSALLIEVPRYGGTHRITFGSFNGVETDLVNPWEAAKKMMQLYRSESLRKELGLKATERAIKEFDWSIIRRQWVDFVNSLIIKESDIPAEWAKLYSETKV